MSATRFENKYLKASDLLFELKGAEPSSKIHNGIASRESMQHMEKSSFAGGLEIALMDSATMFMLRFPGGFSEKSSDYRLLYSCNYSLGNTLVSLIISAAIDSARGYPPRASDTVSKSESKIGQWCFLN
jgi:hypothetical protein